MMQRIIAAALLCAAVAGCRGSGDKVARDSASGAVVLKNPTDVARTGAAVPAGRDSALSYTVGATPSADPIVHVTKTDGKSVSLATKYELTDENFRKYLVASESLAVLQTRDPSVKQLADNPNLSGAGSRDVNAGVKLLESNAAISKAISDQGLSVPDYFVMSIAIAAAERFMNDPKAAPPTPTLQKNADYLRKHPAAVLRLQAIGQGPAVMASS